MLLTKYLIIFWTITSPLTTFFTLPTWWLNADFLRFPFIHQTLSQRLTTTERETTFTRGDGGDHEKIVHIGQDICNLRLDMRDFSLRKTAGCLDESFQILLSGEDNSQHQDTQNKLCGQRRGTTVIIPVTSGQEARLKFQINSEKADWFLNIKQEPCQESIAKKIDVLTDGLQCKTSQTRKILKRTFVQQRKISQCQENSKSIILQIWRFFRQILGFLPDNSCDFSHADERRINRSPDTTDLLKIVGHKSHHVSKDFFKIVQKSSMKSSSQNLSQSKENRGSTKLKEKDSPRVCKVFLLERNKFTCLCT